MISLITFGVSEQTADFRICICHLTKAARQRLPSAEEVSDDAFGSPIPWNLKYTAHELDQPRRKEKVLEQIGSSWTERAGA